MTSSSTTAKKTTSPTSLPSQDKVVTAKEQMFLEIVGYLFPDMSENEKKDLYKECKDKLPSLWEYQPIPADLFRGCTATSYANVFSALPEVPSNYEVIY